MQLRCKAQVLGLWVGLSLAVSGCRASNPSKELVDLAAAQGWLERIEGQWLAKVWGGDYWVDYHVRCPESVFSVGNLMVDGKVTFFEFEVFQLTDTGWTMQPYPMGKPEVLFPQNREASGALLWVFENMENDFPTRIEYDLRDRDRLRVRLSDPVRASDRVEDLQFDRVGANS